MAWSLLLSLLALTWTGAFADSRFAYPEDFRGGRIVSGWEAAEGQFPYQLSLRMVNPVGAVSACGASIIHNEWAITAAHCTALRVTIVIRAGTVNLTRPALIFETTEYYNHPLYIEAMAGVVQPHDIGVIKFNRFVEYTDLIKPIRIQASKDRNVNYSGVRLRAAGWGRTWTLGSSPENMNWVFLTGVSNFDCWMAFGGSPIIVESTICARYYNVTSQSTCQGDSGGTLITEDYDGRDTLVGVTSFVSSTGCHTGFPAGFIRPGFYHEWLSEVTLVKLDWDREEITTPGPEETTTDAAVTTTTTEAAEITTEAGEITTEVEALPPTTEADALPSTTEAEALPSTTEAEALPPTTEAEALPPTTEAEALPSTTEAEAPTPTTEAEAPTPTTEAEALPPITVADEEIL